MFDFFMRIELPVFLTEITVITILFSLRYKRRDRFALRLSITLLCEAAVCGLLGIVYYHLLQLFKNNAVISNIIIICTYLLVFIIVIAGMSFYYREHIWSHIICGVTGYAVQHILYNFKSISFWIFLRNAPLFNDRYGVFAVYFIIETIIEICLILLIYFCVARRANNVAPAGLLGRNVLFLSAGTLFITLAFHAVRNIFAAESDVLNMLCRLFSIVCCVFVLFMRIGIFEKNKLEQDKQIIYRLWNKEREQYEIKKENIELLNIKFHDIKHIIESMEKIGTPHISEELKELKNTVAVYGAAADTGNETLDVIITERNLYCEKHNITFTCIAEGKKLDFMSVTDIYSLLGNAIDNAIDAVNKLQDENQRIISLIIKEAKGMISISVDNYYNDKLDFAGDLPLTTKSDKSFHGYGLKSIKLLAEKYNGSMRVDTSGGMFRLHILIPMLQKG